MPDEAKILSVDGLNEYVKMLLEGNPVLSRVWVRGEISNLTAHSSGHYYFSLKNENARVSALMFRSSAEKLKFRLENGMKVILSGRVSVYTRDGQYQLMASSLEPDGVGALNIAYEQLKRKLESEGLFDPLHKKPLPKIPSRVGVITSPTGAAVRDIINVCTRRFPFAQIVLFPSLVQGNGAEAELISGVEYFNKNKNADVIIIGRGGGSIEDLWAFNSEALARVIYKSEIPIISAVGHETDFTICDYVADRRAPTPSAGAEIAVPDTNELKNKFNNVNSKMAFLLSSKVSTQRERLRLISQIRVLSDPMTYIDDRRLYLLDASKRLENAASGTLKDAKYSLKRLSAVLNAVSPLKILSKGLTSVTDESGAVIRSTKDVDIGKSVSFILPDGTVKASVTEIDIKNGE